MGKSFGNRVGTDGFGGWIGPESVGLYRQIVAMYTDKFDCDSSAALQYFSAEPVLVRLSARVNTY
jgi:hypothetical protein